MAKWTKETILDKLATNDVMVERSLLVMYHAQTADEQMADVTSNENGVGFNGPDAFLMSKFAKWVIGGEIRNIPEGKRLSDKQRAIARKTLAKYARQLLEAVAS